MNAKTIPILPERSCGTCSLCCKVMAVPELDKPRGQWCTHARPGAAAGCSIYESTDKPAICGEFLCVWRQRADVLPDSMRPDRVHALITPTKVDSDGKVFREGIVIHVDANYPDAWRRGPLKELIDRTVRAGLAAVVACGSKRYLYVEGRGMVDVPMDEIDERVALPVGQS